MASGNPFSANVVVPRDAQSVMQVVAASANGVANCQVSTIGAGTIVITRKFVSTGMGCLIVLFFPIGLLLLLAKKTEVLTVNLIPVSGGTRVDVSGVGSLELVSRLSAGLSGLQGSSGELPIAEFAPPTVDEAEFKSCPMCAEQVRSAAAKCRFCGHEFASASE